MQYQLFLFNQTLILKCVSSISLYNGNELYENNMKHNNVYDILRVVYNGVLNTVPKTLCYPNRALRVKLVCISITSKRHSKLLQKR